MKILWMTWKDRSHPQAGGAELINEELAGRLAADGHEVRLLVAGFPGAPMVSKVDGYTVVRLGNRWTVYWHAFRYYRKHLRGWADLVIDEVNTMPFFASWYVRERTVLLVHMLCREIWFYQMSFPLSLVGYVLEPFYLWMLRTQRVITVSESTKRDLCRFGFIPDRVRIIPVAVPEECISGQRDAVKEKRPTMLFVGSLRPMKRPHHVLRAFELAKRDLPDLRLNIIGTGHGRYYEKFISTVCGSTYRADIVHLGAVDDATKRDIMARSHVLCVTSVKEGWGLVVTEAASQGTPAIVYGVDGLRDSVRDGQTGIVCEQNNPASMAAAIRALFESRDELLRLSTHAMMEARQLTPDLMYRKFAEILDLYAS